MNPSSMARTDQDTASRISPPPRSSKRACDCCRKRKVKCDGTSPCGPCKKAVIRCAYLQQPRKKGPKGLRSARVLQAIRNIEEADRYGSISPVENRSFNGNASSSSYSAGSSPVFASAPTSHPFPAAYQETAAGPLHPHSSSHGHPQQESLPVATEGQIESSRIPSDMFYPYVQLFFNHIYPIMPVIDRQVYLNPDIYNTSSCLTGGTYSFLCALSAATIVQLDAAAQLPSFTTPLGMPHAKSAAELFANECLRSRNRFDFIESPSALTVMTSFFLFAYYGNNEQHQQAWYFLQESITFAQELELDDENAILKLDPVGAQWQRRLYWLLFITERAYAIQRRKQTRLQASVQLPSVFLSEDANLLNGFVNLAHLFSAIDDDFVRVWCGNRQRSVCSGPWLADTQRALDGVALALENVTETQHLDIGVTREWLHVLGWQMGVSNGLIWGKGEGGMRLEYPVELARRVVQITGSANSLALDSHGIGMEQKLSDIAGCLADVLKCTAGDTSQTFSQGRQYLHLLLQQLSRMRGKESRYLRPLVSKMHDLIGSDLNQSPALPLPAIEGGPGMHPNSGYTPQHVGERYLETGRVLQEEDTEGP